jgi:NAD-dependent DNA ligase
LAAKAIARDIEKLRKEIRHHDELYYVEKRRRRSPIANTINYSRAFRNSKKQIPN